MKKFSAHIRWYLFAALLIGVGVIWYAVASEDRDGILTVAFLDVGQGDAIFIESPNGTQVLVDGGPNNAVFRELGKVMPFYDRSIDLFIVSNPDKDHIAGFVDGLDRFKVSAVLEPGTVGASGAFRALEAGEEKHRVPKIVARRGMSIDLGGGAYLEILFPDRDVSGLATNDGSIVARLVYGETEVMLPGDAPQNIEQYLVSLDGGKLQSDILKVGHHGSRTSSTESFVEAVAPKYAVISSGKDNRYGHPHKEVMDLFARLGIPALNTANEGTIIFKSDGTRVWRDE